PGENGEPRERPALSNEAGNLLDLRPGAEIRPEELEMRLAAGVLRVGGMEFELTEELKGLLREMTAAEGRLSGQAVVSAAGRAGRGLEQGVRPEEEADDSLAAGPLAYDEWDYRRLGFRKRWCQVRLKEIAPVAGNFVAHTLSKYRGVLTTLRRQFEMMSIQETFVRRQREGSDIDLDAAVEAVADLKAGRAPSERLFVRLQRNDRQIAALFLLDMSSSTEGWVSLALRESLILMCESLRVLGDRYAIYGFSGMRRLRSEIFRIKEFDEPYSEVIKGRIAAITPQEYTRMGPAIRHATTILAGVEARVRLLITLSDGKPEDYDGYKGAYAVEDTRHALIEAKTAGVHPFCITVDREAHGYIAHMYGEINYIFIDQVAKLPLRMPEIYRHLTS
ncbi:MAG: VWA domain-containing protein, partial [Desulfobacteraceae bacterium]|nr:VWA domain-containing protein [Desulfobacteraceae bacterium]